MRPNRGSRWSSLCSYTTRSDTIMEGDSPMQSYTAADALFNLRGNTVGCWADSSNDAAASRIYGGPARISSGYNGPRIAAESPIFAMGSCFAREIEHFLHHHGANVVSIDSSIDIPEFKDKY